MAKRNGTTKGRELERQSSRGNGMWINPKARESVAGLSTERSPVWLEHREQRKEVRRVG